ncbi:MAG: hypothetical protein Ta2A_11420 [Treponemataceae bacterium]|nr:MAG: hypothetical protein Ta2A_11420 [Treponemataceae bacterium]
MAMVEGDYNSGSPLQARHNNANVVAFVFLIAVGLLVLALAVFFILRMINKQKNTPEYIERLKKRRTTDGDIKKVTDIYSFRAEEVAFIVKLCAKTVVPNIVHVLENTAIAYQFFKDTYHFLVFGGLGDAEHYTTVLFSVMDKVSKQFQFTSAITSSFAIPVGQIVYYVDASGRKHESTLVGNNSNGIVLTVPLDGNGQELRPPELQTINLFFVGVGDLGYTTSVRVVRYQERANRHEMVVTHTSYFVSHLRHEYTYVSVKLPCTCTVTEADGTERLQKAMLVNYCGSNCNVVLPFDPGAGTHFEINMTLPEASPATISVIAATVATLANGTYLVHANYVEMPQNIKNYIFAHTNGFI